MKTTFSDILAVERQNEVLAQTLGVRSGNALKILKELYRIPLTDAQQVSTVAGISIPSAYKLIEEMQHVGLLHEATGAKRGKVYILKNYFEIFNRPVTYNDKLF